MIKNSVIIVLLLASSFANAQYKTIDSLLIVKNYIQTIQENIPKEVKEVAKKTEKLDSLIRLGTQKKDFFNRQLQVVLKHNPKEIKELLRKYDLVLQSAILVKTDLKQNQLGNQQTKEERHYLYKNSSFLIEKIYFYANYYKTKTEELTH